MNRDTLYQKLFAPVDAASIAVFRMLFGTIVLWEVWRYFDHGWIARYYVDKDFLFKYYGFGWVHPWPGDGMYWHFAVLGLAALCVATGTLYRIASVVLLAAFSYVFLLSQARYLNHFYFVILIATVMCFLPAHRYWSVDAMLRPRLRSATVPRWALWALLLQFELVLFYAGLVKVNHDWLHGQPLLLWFESRRDWPLVGPLLANDITAYVASYAAIALHLIGAPLLLWRRTRLGAFCAYLGFHLCNAFLFAIGIFPWLTIGATLMFFEPDWPRRVGRWLRRVARGDGIAVGAAALGAWPDTQPIAHAPRRSARIAVAVLATIFALQAVVPLRHLLYPGNVDWTQEGHRFSWRMKLRDTNAHAEFRVVDPVSGRTIRVRSADYLDRRQRHKMASRPDMILQFAHHLASVSYERWGIRHAEVYANVKNSLNGRPPAVLIDPDRDLARVQRNLWHADWIMPLPDAVRDALPGP